MNEEIRNYAPDGSGYSVSTVETASAQILLEMYLSGQIEEKRWVEILGLREDVLKLVSERR